MEGCGEVLGRVLVGGKGQRWGSVKVWGVMGVLGGGKGGLWAMGGRRGVSKPHCPPPQKGPGRCRKKCRSWR